MSTTQVLAQNHASLSSYEQLNLHVYKDFQFLLKKRTLDLMATH